MAYKVKSTGRWAAQAREGGRRVQLGTFATLREAKLAEAAHRRRTPRGDTTVAEWATRWLASKHWRESTRQHNTERVARFIAEHGHLPLAGVTRTLARDWITQHPSTHSALAAMFGAALYHDDEHGQPLIPFNPFSRLVKRTRRRRDLQADWLRLEDINSLVIHTGRVLPMPFATTAAAMIRFAAETGIRPGELFALTWDDLNINAGTLVVARAADSKTRTITLPKNGQRREIVLSAEAAMAAGRAGTSEGLIFRSPRGQQWWTSSWLYYWHQIRAAAQRPSMDFYELRHYCATRLVEAGLSYVDVAIQLGHTDGGELARTTYTHPSQRRALERVRQTLNA